MTAAVLNERTSFILPEVSNGKKCFASNPTEVSIKVENYEESNGFTSEKSLLKHQKEELDPKLLQAAQLFVQDLLVRAKIEAQKKLASSERQALLHEDSFVPQDTNANFVDRIRQEVRRKCRRIYNLFLSCLGHLP